MPSYLQTVYYTISTCLLLHTYLYGKIFICDKIFKIKTKTKQKDVDNTLTVNKQPSHRILQKLSLHFGIGF